MSSTLIPLADHPRPPYTSNLPPQPPSTNQPPTSNDQNPHSRSSQQPSQDNLQTAFLEAAVLLSVASLAVLMEGGGRLSRLSSYIHTRNDGASESYRGFRDSFGFAEVCYLLIDSFAYGNSALNLLFAFALIQLISGFASLLIAFIGLFRQAISTSVLNVTVSLQPWLSFCIFVINVIAFHVRCGRSFLPNLLIYHRRRAIAFLGLQLANIDLAIFGFQLVSLLLLRAAVVKKFIWWTFKLNLFHAIFWNINWALLGLWFILYGLFPLPDLTFDPSPPRIGSLIGGGAAIIMGALLGILVAVRRKGLLFYAVGVSVVQAIALALIPIARPALDTQNRIILFTDAPLNAMYVFIAGLLPVLFVYKSFNASSTYGLRND